jgi:hypothetical protein
MIKRKAQRIHAKRRFLERTGWSLTSADLDALSLQIRQGKAKFLRKQSNRVSHWEAESPRGCLRLVYDSRTKQVVTVLPKEEQSGQ